MKKNNKIKIRVNGKLLRIDRKTTLFKYIKKIKVPLNKIAIELNHESGKQLLLRIDEVGLEPPRLVVKELTIGTDVVTHQLE